MNNILKPENRNNLGGNYKLQIMLFHDLFKIGDALKGEIKDFDIFDNSFVIEIDCTIETIDDIVKKKRGKNGIIFEVDINAQIPKTRLEARNELELLDNKKFVVLLYDNNGFIRLFGDLKNPMRFSDDTDKRGASTSNINAYQFTLSGEFTYRPYYVKNDFTTNFVTPIFQHIFFIEINESNRIQDNSDFGNDARLQSAPCINMFQYGYIDLPKDIDYTGYTVSHDGTADISLDIANKRITLNTPGTIFNMIIEGGAQTYTYPCCEGDLTHIHDVERGERAWLTNTEWTTQSQHFYMNLVGGDEITSTLDPSKRLFVPYNTLSGRIYNGKADNRWYAGINYLIDMIVKRNDIYYKCNTAHTSADWDTETANWTAI